MRAVSINCIQFQIKKAKIVMYVFQYTLLTRVCVKKQLINVNIYSDANETETVAMFNLIHSK